MLANLKPLQILWGSGSELQSPPSGKEYLSHSSVYQCRHPTVCDTAGYTDYPLSAKSKILKQEVQNACDFTNNFLVVTKY